MVCAELTPHGNTDEDLRLSVTLPSRTNAPSRSAIGDGEIVAAAQETSEKGDCVYVVTADRILMGRVERYGATVLTPTWLLPDLDQEAATTPVQPGARSRSGLWPAAEQRT